MCFIHSRFLCCTLNLVRFLEWIPAFAGMTNKKPTTTPNPTMDSRLRENDEQEPSTI